MKKLFNIVAAAAVMISAGAAMAQTGNGSDVTGGTVSSTIGGLYTPSGQVRGGSFSAPSSTPVSLSLAGSAGRATSGVISGTPGSATAFTGGLTAAGVPAAAAQGITDALGALRSGGSVTFGNVATALAGWNNAVASLSRPQLMALMRSPQGRAAYTTLVRARASAAGAAGRAGR